MQYQIIFTWFCETCTISDTKITSCANKRLEISVKSRINCIQCLPCCIISSANSFIKMQNKNGLHFTPCLRPLGHINDSFKSLTVRTFAFYKIVEISYGLTHFPFYPNCPQFCADNRIKCFLKSTNAAYIFHILCVYSNYFWINVVSMNRW